MTEDKERDRARRSRRMNEDARPSPPPDVRQCYPEKKLCIMELRLETQLDPTLSPKQGTCWDRKGNKTHQEVYQHAT